MPGYANVISWFRRYTLTAHCLVLLLCIGLVLQWPVAAFVVLIVYVATLGLASMNMGMNLYVDTLRRIAPQEGATDESSLAAAGSVSAPSGGQIALTFDDSPTEGTAQVLALLREHQVKATFFIVGAHAQARPDLLRQIVQEGHAIGNHSYSHAHTLPVKARSTILADLQRCNQTIHEITGLTPQMYRPPFGVVNPGIAAAVQASRLPCVGWTVRSFDTVASDPQRLLAKVLRQLEPGAIVLLHDYPAITPKVLPALLQEIRKRNLSCVALTPEILRP